MNTPDNPDPSENAPETNPDNTPENPPEVSVTYRKDLIKHGLFIPEAPEWHRNLEYENLPPCAHKHVYTPTYEREEGFFYPTLTVSLGIVVTDVPSNVLLSLVLEECKSIPNWIGSRPLVGKDGLSIYGYVAGGYDTPDRTIALKNLYIIHLNEDNSKNLYRLTALHDSNDETAHHDTDYMLDNFSYVPFDPSKPLPEEE